MITVKKGDKVTYRELSHDPGEIGIVKSVRPDGLTCYVVYDCDGKWDRYERYTGVLTSISKLEKGWTNDKH